VCLQNCQCSLSKLLKFYASCCGIDVTSTQRHVSCFLSASYVSVFMMSLSPISCSNLRLKVGVVLGLIFVEPSSLPDIPGHFAIFLEDYDISLSVPQIDLSSVQAEWKRLLSTIPEPWKLNTDGREFQVGDAIKARGLEAKHPVVLIPGVISTVYSLSAVLFDLASAEVMLYAVTRVSNPGQRHRSIAPSFAKRYGEGSP
jgi:hypothetical protein